MGCDIHLQQEVKIKGVWHHYAHCSTGRNYKLFAKMGYTDRASGIDPVAPLRGFPEDATYLTAFIYQDWGIDAHNPSWLNADEIRQVIEWKAALKEPFHYPPEWGYFFGNGWDAWVRYPDDCKRLRDAGVEDIRWIFWFDN